MTQGSDTAELPIDGREGLVLFFNVGDSSYGIRLTEVIRIDEVEDNEGDGKFPKDEGMELVNLRQYFETGLEEKEGGILIVFDTEENSYGMLADAVDGIIPAQQAPELNWPPHIDGEPAKIFSGFFRRGEKLVPAINAAAIMEAATGGGR